MAFRVYQNVPLSTVTKIIFADVNDGVYSKYTEPNHVAHIYTVLKYLPVTGFVMYDNGALVVSIMSVKELAANVIRKFWKARQLRKKGCEVSLAPCDGTSLKPLAHAGTQNLPFEAKTAHRTCVYN